MKISYKIITLLFGLAVFAACTKSDTDNGSDNNTGSSNNNPTPQPTKKELLTNAVWQVTGATLTTKQNGKDTTADVYTQMDDCEKDNRITFMSDGTYTVDEHTNKCAGEPQSITFTWALLENDTKLALVDSNPDTLNVDELTTTKLVISITKPNPPNEPVTARQTLTNVK